MIRCPYCDELRYFSSGASYRVHKCRYHRGVTYRQPQKVAEEAAITGKQQIEAQSRAPQTPLRQALPQRPQKYSGHDSQVPRADNWAWEIAQEAVVDVLKERAEAERKAFNEKYAKWRAQQKQHGDHIPLD